MTDPQPEHIDAVARMLYLALPDPDVHCWDDLDGFARSHYRTQSLALLDSTDPAVHAAMLDALTRHGVLTEERRTLADGWASHIVSADGITKRSGKPGTRQRRLVTSWEVTP